MRKFILTTLLLALPLVSSATLNLELTKGVRRAIPIAIVPFSDDGKITSIMKADLAHSGRFSIAEKLPEKPTDTTNIRLNKWRRIPVNAVVVGAVKSAGSGKLHVHMQLIDTFAKNVSAGLLVNKDFVVREKNLRHLAHRLSDIVYYKLTGKKGVFSTKIAYVVEKRGKRRRSYKLMIADADGFNPRPLLKSNMPIMSPTWSPKGKKIAYVSFEGRTANIIVQDVRTGHRERVSHAPGINGAPTFSPDGKYLAFVLTKTDYPKIYLYNIRSKKLTQITKGWSIDTEPRFSPGGQQLIFTSSRSGGPQIYRIGIRNGKAVGKPTRVTFNGGYNARASFTPDGKALVVLHRDPSSGYVIAKQELTTGVLSELSHGHRAQSPSIAPNGDMVLYADTDKGRQVLHMVSMDGRVSLALPASEGFVREPAWAPFG